MRRLGYGVLSVTILLGACGSSSVEQTGGSDTTSDSGGCGDGVAAVGEFCHREVVELLDVPVDVAAIGDIDGDGWNDIAMGTWTTETVHVLYGDGAGGYDEELEVEGGGVSTSIAVADLDGDGRGEVVSGSRFSEQLYVFSSRDGLVGVRLCCDGCCSTEGLAIADVDADGFFDVIATVGGIAVAYGNGTLVPDAPVAFDLGWGPTSVHVGDVSGDGALDLVAVNATRGEAVVVENLGGRRFGRAVSVAAAPFADGIATLGGQREELDLVSGSPSSEAPGLVVSANRGNWLFERLDVPYDRPVYGIATADLDGDGARDIVMAGGEDVPGITVVRGLDASYGGTVEQFGDPATGRRVAIGDLNGDGVDDVVVPQSPSVGAMGYVLLLSNP